MLMKLRNVTLAAAAMFVTLPSLAETSQHMATQQVYDFYRPVVFKMRVEQALEQVGLSLLANQFNGSEEWLVVNGRNMVGRINFVGIDQETGNSSFTLYGYDNKILFSAREVYDGACAMTSIHSDLIPARIIDNKPVVDQEKNARYRVANVYCRGGGYFAIRDQEANRFIWEGEVGEILGRAVKILTATQGAGLVLPFTSKLELALGPDKYILRDVIVGEGNGVIILTGSVPSTAAYSILIRRVMEITDAKIIDRLVIFWAN